MASTEVQVAQESGSSSERAAADIWARATARRDNLPTPVPIEEKLPGIRGRLADAGGALHLARVRGNPVGFLLTVARPQVLEVVYFAVDPSAWGSGIGRQLLSYADNFTHAAGYSDLSLWVIDDNERALRTYARSGWTPTQDQQVNPSTGRTERRLAKSIDS